MTKLLEKAIERAKGLPEAGQDAVALAILAMADEDFAAREPLDDETRAAIRKGLREAERGEFASEEEVASLWRRYGL